MKSMIAALIMVTASSAFAKPQPEFCKLERYEEQPSAFYEVEKNIRDVNALPPFVLKMVNEYLVGYGYFKRPASIHEIKALFSTTGEEQFNDLIIKQRKSKRTGEIHYEVVSYPGDNAVGYVFDVEGHKIGENGDDSYAFFVNGKRQWCGNN